METTNRDVVEIDLKDLFFALLDKIWIIILAGIVCALAAFLYTKFMVTPMYQSTSSVYILNRQNQQITSSSDLSSASQLVKDCKELIVRRTVLEQVIEKLGLNMTYEQLAGSVSVGNPTDTRVIEITVKNSDPVRARDIVNLIREISAGEMEKIMNLEKVELVEPGHLPSGPYSPSLKKNMMIAGLLGVMIACIIIIMLHLLDDTIKNSDDVERYLGLSVLGSIPDAEIMAGGKKNKNKKAAK